MASNKNQNGYSDALGGFGVPTQVKRSAAYSTAAAAKPSGGAGLALPSFSFQKNKKIIIIVAAAVVVAIVLILLLNGTFDEGRYASKIVEPIATTMQSSNGAPTTNYMPTLAADVDWAAISEGEREGIAKYAVKKALQEAEKDQVNIFNILGMTSDSQPQPAFMYDQNNKTVQIIVNYEVKGTVEL